MLKLNHIKIGAALLLSLGLSGCILQKDKIANVDQAENILITSNGRLLVTGGKGIYEIEADNPTQPIPLFNGIDNNDRSQGKWNVKVGAEKCNFTGMAQHEKWLFATCLSIHHLGFLTVNHLLYAELDLADPEAEILFQKLDMPYEFNNEYNKLAIPNGMATDEDGNLFVANSDYLFRSGIARVELSYSGSRPQVMNVDKAFVSPREHGTVTPNGVRTANGYLYFSDANKVKRAKILGDGSISKNVATMWKSAVPDLLDDIMPYCEGVLITDFISGQVHYAATVKLDINDDSKDEFVPLFSSILANYGGPSSIAVGPVPGGLTAEHELLVTEKLSSNLVTTPVYSAGEPIDLTSAQTCAEIEQAAREKLGY